MRKISTTRSRIVVTVGFVGVLLAACAITVTDIKPEEVTEVELLMRRAEAAGAGDLAPELLGSARQSFEASRRASFQGNGEDARRRLAEARAYAEAAEVRATAERRQREAAEVGQQVDALDTKLQDLHQRLRKPGQ